MTDGGDIYFTAPFAADGAFLGVGICRVSELNMGTLNICRELLRVKGSSFSGICPFPYEWLSLKFTSAHGAALVTYFVDGRPVSSNALLCGFDIAVDRDVLGMFFKSICGLEIVKRLNKKSQPFVEMLTVSERPIHIVVAWGTQDEARSKGLVDFGKHFAAAFLLRCD